VEARLGQGPADSSIIDISPLSRRAEHHRRAHGPAGGVSHRPAPILFSVAQEEKSRLGVGTVVAIVVGSVVTVLALIAGGSTPCGRTWCRPWSPPPASSEWPPPRCRRRRPPPAGPPPRKQPRSPALQRDPGAGRCDRSHPAREEKGRRRSGPQDAAPARWAVAPPGPALANVAPVRVEADPSARVPGPAGLSPNPALTAGAAPAAAGSTPAARQGQVAEPRSKPTSLDNLVDDGSWQRSPERRRPACAQAPSPSRRTPWQLRGALPRAERDPAEGLSRDRCAAACSGLPSACRPAAAACPRVTWSLSRSPWDGRNGRHRRRASPWASTAGTEAGSCVVASAKFAAASPASAEKAVTFQYPYIIR